MRKGLLLGVFSSILLVSLTTTQLVFADGDDSPAGCKGGPTDNSGGDTMLDAGVGNIIPTICIKSGETSFGLLKHSGEINADGTYGDGDAPNTCYDVSGLGTQMVSVTFTDDAGCHDISHVDYFIDSDGVPPSEIVGGTLLSIDTTTLLLGYGIVNAIWLAPTLAGIGIGVYLVKTKWKKSENS